MRLAPERRGRYLSNMPRGGLGARICVCTNRYTAHPKPAATARRSSILPRPGPFPARSGGAAGGWAMIEGGGVTVGDGFGVTEPNARERISLAFPCPAFFSFAPATTAMKRFPPRSACAWPIRAARWWRCRATTTSSS